MEDIAVAQNCYQVSIFSLGDYRVRSGNKCHCLCSVSRSFPNAVPFNFVLCYDRVNVSTINIQCNKAIYNPSTQTVMLVLENSGPNDEYIEHNKMMGELITKRDGS